MEVNKAGKMNVFTIKAIPDMEPIIIGLKIVPDVIPPVEIKIPINTGVIIAIVSAIVPTESIAKLYEIRKLFIVIPIITRVHMSILISATDLLLNDVDRFFNIPMIIHTLIISTLKIKALFIS